MSYTLNIHCKGAFSVRSFVRPSVSQSIHWSFCLSFRRMDASLSACQTCFTTMYGSLWQMEWLGTWGEKRQYVLILRNTMKTTRRLANTGILYFFFTCTVQYFPSCIVPSDCTAQSKKNTTTNSRFTAPTFSKSPGLVNAKDRSYHVL